MAQKDFYMPSFLEVELDYSYMPGPVVYKFPRKRAKDAKADEQERMLGDGRKMSAACRLSLILEDASGWPGLAQRGSDEAEGVWRQRVLLFFDNDEMQEFAEEALLGRLAAANPRPTFRSSSDSRLAVHVGREEAAGQALAPLPEVHEAGTTARAGMSDLRTDAGPAEAEEGHTG